MQNNHRLVYFNGKLVPETEAKISVYDSALMFGDMVFEMTRSFNKKQFKLREHIDRLYAGVKVLRIPLQMTPEEMEKACFETIDANDHLFKDDDEHRLMIDVSRGLLGIYQGIEGLHKGPNVIIADFPLRWTVATMGALFDKGINAVITSQRAIPGHLLDPKIKNRSRIHYLMANIEAGQIEGDNNWALLLDTDGFVAEGTRMVCAKMLRDGLSVHGLIITVFIKTNREGFYGAYRQRLHYPNHRRRIDSTRQKCSQRNIRHHLLTNRMLKQRIKLIYSLVRTPTPRLNDSHLFYDGFYVIYVFDDGMAHDEIHTSVLEFKLLTKPLSKLGLWFRIAIKHGHCNVYCLLLWFNPDNLSIWEALL